ncbi:glucose 1-dehydrogenase [Rhizorhabdus argentea]|uniref:glucose 1-dehydrogenase n=1 Tax=Rhizorhabdus argentea TaxID=1387174 RepID=UPI0030EBD770
MARVEGKIAIVTGGARGMGASFARALVREGAKVFLTDVLEEEGQAVARDCGPNARFARHDVTKEGEWKDVVRQAEDAFGPVSVLVNNAGIVAYGAIETMEEKDYRRVIDVNQVGTYLGMKSVIPSMKRAGGGAIINMSSVAGLMGAAHVLPYTASKFAVRGMTKAAAIELAPDGIRVNSVHPGMIRTPMAIPTEESASIIDDFIAATPAQRWGECDEIAAVIVMLASDEVRFATGAEFVIDGGISCQ